MRKWDSERESAPLWTLFSYLIESPHPPSHPGAAVRWPRAIDAFPFREDSLPRLSSTAGRVAAFAKKQRPVSRHQDWNISSRLKKSTSTTIPIFRNATAMIFRSYWLTGQRCSNTKWRCRNSGVSCSDWADTP